MAHIEFLDETMRDGQQSLWGMRMQAGMALPVAPLIDRTGFRVIDLAGSSLFEVMIRHCRENPWEGLDLLVQAMPRTRLRGGMRSNASVTFGVTPDALMDAWMRQLNRHGCRSFWIYDVLFNIDKMHRLAKVAKEFGSRGRRRHHVRAVAGAYRRVLRRQGRQALGLARHRHAAAVRHRRRARQGAAADAGARRSQAKARGKPIEFHANNILGQSAKAYLDAIDLGVTILHTASRPMANGPSVPSTEIMLHNIELLGHTHSIDKSLLPPVAEHFERVGKAAGFLVNQHNEYDVLSIRHQIPGGMTGTLKAQLAQHNMSEKLEEVMRETAEVRRDLGYPGMATPFSQLVGIQAVLNVVTGKRYSIVPDEVIQYAAGFYGETVAPIDPNVRDKIMAAPRAREVAGTPPEQPTIQELRKRYGTDDDDELILRALVPAPDLEKMRAAGPVKRDYPTLSSPELEQVQTLMRTAKSPVVQMRTASLSLELNRQAS